MAIIKSESYDMLDGANDIPQPYSVRHRGREWEVVVLPMLPRAKATMVAHEPNESVAETIAEECNAAVVAYAKAVMARAKRWQATPKPKTVREPKELGAVRAAETTAVREAAIKVKGKAKAVKVKAEPEVKAQEPGDRVTLLRQILALPAVQKAIKDGNVSLQTLKKDSYSRLLRCHKQLLPNGVTASIRLGACGAVLGC